MTHEQRLVAFVAWAVGFLVLTAPLVRYVGVGWKQKRKDIMDGVGAEARLAYFQMFERDGKPITAEEAPKRFEDLYHEWYGRQFFVFPTIIFAAIGAMVVTTITLTGLHRLHYATNPLFDLPDTALAALAGAYLWVVNDHIARVRRLDFTAAEVHWASLRLVIAIPMGYAFAKIAAPGIAPFIAFALGAFPLATLNSTLSKLTEKRLDIAATADEAHDDIIALQGVNKDIAERLANEDIRTVLQMAYCDPVRVVMRSNLTFIVVSDWMSQALAWIYFEDKLVALRALGLRGAVEIKNFVDALNADVSQKPELKAVHDLAVSALPKVAEVLKQDPATVAITLSEIAEDPFTVFLDRVWG